MSVVEMGTEGVGQQVEQLLRLSRRKGKLRMDFGGESTQYTLACGRLHGLVRVCGCCGVAVRRRRRCLVGWSEADDEGGPGGSGRCRLMRT